MGGFKKDRRDDVAHIRDDNALNYPRVSNVANVFARANFCYLL